MKPNETLIKVNISPYCREMGSEAMYRAWQREHGGLMWEQGGRGKNEGGGKKKSSGLCRISLLSPNFMT